MLPTINGKSFLDCTEEDLKELLGNTAYREDEHIDYKETFAIDSYSKGDNRRDKAIAELRSDICAFANANGGYLLFGIQEDGEGVAKEIIGVAVDNKDRFELTLNNWLQSIQPRIPMCRLSFISLSNERYVIILFVAHDSFAPYVHLENEKDYRIYKRISNSKRPIMYSELKTMFMQSLVLEREIEKYRKDRSEYFEKTQGFPYNLPKYIMLHIFPDTFLDSNYNKPMYALELRGAQFKNIFSTIGCSGVAFPTVDGIRCDSYHRSNRIANIGNNGVVEILIKDDEVYFDPIGSTPARFYHHSVVEKLFPVIKEYVNKARKYLRIRRIIVAVSIVGLEDYLCEQGELHFLGSHIDRQLLYCNPIVFTDIENDNKIEEDMKRLELDFYYSIGLQQDERMKELTKEIYGE